MNNDQKAIQIVIEFDGKLLNHILGAVGVPGWSRYARQLLDSYLIPVEWIAGQKPEPLGVMLDFDHIRMPHYNLDGIDLSLCWLEAADFTSASLKDASIGSCPNAIFRGARLHECEFLGDISGCHFEDATGLDTAKFGLAVYQSGNPPVGLPPDALAACRLDTEPPQANPRAPRNPMEPTGFQQAPLKCHASIHVIPTGNLR